MENTLILSRCRDPHDPRMEAAMQLYQISFPAHELRLWPDQMRAMQEEAYHVDLAMWGEAFAGMILYWVLDGMIYVEHFCVSPALRGQGIGRAILAQLAGLGMPLVLEIDPPVDEISIRRRGFYERCGYVANAYPYRHPSYQIACQPHPLVIMSYPRAITPDEFARFKQMLHDTVMRYSEGRRSE